MTYRDLLLGVLTYPDATPDCAVRSGVGLASRIGGECTLFTLQVDIPEMHNRIANALLDFDRLTRDAEALCVLAAAHATADATEAAALSGTKIRAVVGTARLYEESELLCAAARTHDLCLLPVGPQTLASRAMAEAVLFGSGRPVMVYPEDVKITSDTRFAVVVIAWDSSPRAARAVADALPILKAAETVRILVVTDDKPEVKGDCSADLDRHLQAHGIAAVVEELPAGGRPTGEVLRSYVESHEADLLVMGGYGHPRIREFVLGGATETILEHPPGPVLMSH